MIRALLSFVIVGLLGSLVGCGGSSAIGRNSDVTVHLRRTDGTQTMTNYELYLTKNGATAFSLGNVQTYASTLNGPTWCDGYSANRTASELQLDFRTRSDQPPYFLFVKVPNTGASFETLELQIDIDTATGTKKRYNLTINSTQRLLAVQIDRNSATY